MLCPQDTINGTYTQHYSDQTSVYSYSGTLSTSGDVLLFFLHISKINIKLVNPVRLFDIYIESHFQMRPDNNCCNNPVITDLHTRGDMM